MVEVKNKAVSMADYYSMKNLAVALSADNGTSVNFDWNQENYEL